MKIKDVFKIALRSLKCNKMYFVLTVILLVLCLILFGICEFFYVRVDYNRYVADRVLSKGNENTGVIRIDTSDTENQIKFRLEAFESGIVDSIGASTVYGVDWPCLEGLIAIQSGKSETLKAAYPDMYETYKIDTLGYIGVDATIMNLCDLKLQKGSMINKDNFDYEDQNLVAMYLGDLFSDIPVGTEYELKLGKDRTITIRVMGIIEKGEEWIHESILDFQGKIEKAKYNLDNEVIMTFNDEIDMGMMLFSLNDGADMEETQKKLYDLADKHNIDVTIGNVSGRFDGVEAQYKDVRETLLSLLIFVTVVSTMIIICFNAASILLRKKQYGVLLADGVSMERLFVSLFIEQFIKALTGLAVSVLLVYFGAPGFFWGEGLEAAYDIFLNFVLGKAALFCVLECIIVSVASAFILGRYKPVQLIKYRTDS